MRPKHCWAAAAVAFAAALSSCERRTTTEQSGTIRAVVETQWTKSAAERNEALTDAALKQDPSKGALKYALPRLRVYDAKGQLVYQLDPTLGWKPETIGGVIDQAIASGRAVTGPSLNETLADLQTSAGQSARAVVASGATPLVFDYWASWCVPCKILEKALIRWQAAKALGSVQIVKAEADPMKLTRERGEKIFMVKKGPDGKLHKFEMK